MRTRNVVRLVCLLVCLLAVGWFVRVMYLPHPELTEKPLSLAEFNKRYGVSDFPATAKNIYFGRSSVGMGGRAYIYRFEAPIEDCIAHAKAEFDRYNEMLYDDPKDYPPSDPIPIESVPDEKPFKPDLSSYWLTRLDWFDVDRIREGLTIPREKAHHPFIWIDTDRGILYFFWTD